MATSTFDRKIEIETPEALEKLVMIMASEDSVEPISDHSFSTEERKRIDALLKQYKLHST